MDLTRSTRPVAPGTTLTSFDRLEPDKWLRADALSVDLDSGTRADYLSSGRVSERKTVGELARDHRPGKGRRTVAAFNADFFDIDQTGAPLGPGVRKGKPTHSAAPGTTNAVGIDPGGAGRILDLYFRGTVQLPGGAHRLGSFNAADVPVDSIGVYNAQWGEADRAQTVDGARTTTEVRVRNGKVTAVSTKPGAGPLPKGTTALLGRDRAAGVLADLRPGDPVSVSYRVRTRKGQGGIPRTAVGGRGLLVVDGKPQNWEGKPNNEAAPRTAVGFSRDGNTMHVLTVDGRQPTSGGVTLTQLARMMRELGAHNALNLDGGGSSTLLARQPGSDQPRLENSPSDGEQRLVPNGLALTAPDGSGRLRGFRVAPRADREQAPGVDAVPGGHPDRVFPGLTRTLRADGYDETYGPAAGHPRWASSRRTVGTVDRAGVFHARHTGHSTVSARQGGAEGSTRLRVLGELDRLEVPQRRVGLADPSATGRFGVVGRDARGNSAPVEPSDLRLEYDRSLFTVTPDPGRGGFTVRARTSKEFVSGLVKASVGGRSTTLAVTVGLHDRDTATFEDAGDWTFSAARAEGSAATEPKGHQGGGLRLRYDFSQSTATRAAYVTPPKPLTVEGRPNSFSLWIKGDGNGAWPSLQLRDAQGTQQVLRGELVEWTDWQQVTFPVPEGLAGPLTVERLYLAETRAEAQYEGEVVLDQLTAQTPPEVELPAQPTVRDPLIGSGREVADRDWRFAVVSDAQFVAREPDGEAVRQARRTLREARAQRPDMILINGDLVDEGSPEDLAFAHKVLKQELGDAVPWRYVPGNHEVMGGDIDNFEKEFGPGHGVFDHRGTRFVTLDTSSLTIRGGGYSQFRSLRRQLDQAARDPGVRSVVLVQHVPPRDPAPTGASQLTDRVEADLVEDWLGDFARRSGKGVAFVGGHTGAFHASRVDGVPYLVNGNSGKAPATAPDEGGFTGWSLVGVDRSGRGDWISAATRPHVDGLTLSAPGSLRVGQHDRASATVTQGQGTTARKVPVNWPVSADWSGTRGLCVRGEGAAARGGAGRCVVRLDPGTGRLDALRAGTVTLRVTVAGERAQHRLRVRR
ncbi:phosphodiester glycosidase family protein [Streptomyces sp. NPDC005438]|uniref:phosphodiester glycosidase family protein n=1 Tax=Streptomyces sp. NPDC005438 TaxID=3156880 RepID=UPI0033BBC15A